MTGWQTLTFATPVDIVAGQTYVASYTVPNGHYAADASYFERTGVTATPLVAPATGVNGGVNGVYRVGTGFPTSSYRGGNYWVDVVVVPASGGSTVTQSAAARAAARTATVVTPLDRPAATTVVRPKVTRQRRRPRPGRRGGR